MATDTPTKSEHRRGLTISSALDPAAPTNPARVVPSYAHIVEREARAAADRLTWHEHNPGLQSVDYQTRPPAGTGVTQTIHYWQMVRTVNVRRDDTKVETIYFLTKDSGVIGSIQSINGVRQLAPVVNLQWVDSEVLKMLLFVLTRLG